MWDTQLCVPRPWSLNGSSINALLFFWELRLLWTSDTVLDSGSSACPAVTQDTPVWLLQPVGITEPPVFWADSWDLHWLQLCSSFHWPDLVLIKPLRWSWFCLGRSCPMRTGERAQLWGALAVLVETSVISNLSSRGASALIWSPWTLYACGTRPST